MKSERKKIYEWFHNKKVFLFDLDGTLYLGDKVLPGARQLIARLRSAHKHICFFTNNSSRSDADYYRKLTKMGFHPARHEIIMSTHTVIRYLKQKKLRSLFCLGTPAMKKMLNKAGLKTASQSPQVVIVGFDKTLTWKKLYKACQYIDRGLPYVVAHPDFFCPTPEGPEPDSGAFALAIEKITGRKPSVVLGKPHPSMIEEALKRYPMSRKNFILIGDRLMTDIQMAKNAKVDSLLVFTGDTKASVYRRSRLKAEACLSSVAELL